MDPVEGQPLFRANFDHSAVACIFSHLDEKITAGNENGLIVQYDLSNDERPLNTNEVRFPLLGLNLELTDNTQVLGDGHAALAGFRLHHHIVS